METFGVEPIFLGKTFNDFLLRPHLGVIPSRHNKTSPVNISMPLVRGLNISLPIVGANMDTVMGSKMMSALSLEGAFGFLPRSCSIEDQCKMATEVKRQHAYIIYNPLILNRKTTLADARRKIEYLGVSGVLVEDGPETNQLTGILSHRDVPPDWQIKANLAIENFMTPLSRLVFRQAGISIDEAEKVMYEHRIEKLPLVDEQGKIVGLITYRDVDLYKTKPFASRDTMGRFLVGAAVGVSGDYMERAEALVDVGVDCILLDIAHGHSIVMRQALRQFRSRFPDLPLIAGNVATGDGARALVEWGADAVKVGVGPGFGCRTRIETGAGVPQLQAIREAHVATRGTVPIIADGGVSNNGDIAKAICAGASSVMLGSKLAGTDEAPGVKYIDPRTKQVMKSYRGMTSPGAVMASLNQSAIRDSLEVPAEGQANDVPYSGSLVSVLNGISGHLKSAVSYLGFNSLFEAHTIIGNNPTKYFNPVYYAAQRESFDR